MLNAPGPRPPRLRLHNVSLEILYASLTFLAPLYQLIEATSRLCNNSKSNQHRQVTGHPPDRCRSSSTRSNCICKFYDNSLKQNIIKKYRLCYCLMPLKNRPFITELFMVAGMKNICTLVIKLMINRKSII